MRRGCIFGSKERFIFLRANPPLDHPAHHPAQLSKRPVDDPRFIRQGSFIVIGFGLFGLLGIISFCIHEIYEPFKDKEKKESSEGQDRRGRQVHGSDCLKSSFSRAHGLEVVGCDRKWRRNEFGISYGKKRYLNHAAAM